MAVFTRGNYNCACSREVCDWACTTYATMMSDLVPNTASQPFKSLSKPFKSNADRIRAMSDEELAEFLLNRDLDVVEKASKAVGFTYKVDREPCLFNVIDWLKEEAKDD